MSYLQHIFIPGNMQLSFCLSMAAWFRKEQREYIVIAKTVKARGRADI
jgi:hypothetical protein